MISPPPRKTNKQKTGINRRRKKEYPEIHRKTIKCQEKRIEKPRKSKRIHENKQKKKIQKKRENQSLP